MTNIKIKKKEVKPMNEKDINEMANYIAASIITHFTIDDEETKREMVKQCFVISSHLMKKELKNISDFTNDMHRMYSDLIENGKEYDNDSLIWRGHRVIFLLNYCCKFNTISLDEMVKRKNAVNKFVSNELQRRGYKNE